MSNERDELRGTLSNTICNASFYPAKAQPYLLGGDMSTVLDKTSDAIIAAGYRKPRIITTTEELATLGFEVVIRDADGHVLERWGDGDDAMVWVTVGVNHFVPAGEITLPATAIYDPAAQ